MALAKHVIRAGIIGSIGLVSLAAIAGPDRVGALFTQARGVVNDKIDKAITDPVALRAQLRDLQEQYPKRIADVRGDLAQLKAQQAQLQRDLTVSKRVIELADGDMERLTAALQQAETAKIQNVSYGEDHEIVIVYKGERITVPVAQTKANQVGATRVAYGNRVADIERDLGYLSQQELQLTQLATKLENEQTSFQTQMFDLDRQIDAIGRNDRMISIMSDRQKSLDEQSRYRAASLDQISTKLADIRARQESQLKSLGKVQDHFAYEDAAKSQLDREGGLNAAKKANDPKKPAPTVIEIDPARLPAMPSISPAAPKEKPKADAPVASR